MAAVGDALKSLSIGADDSSGSEHDMEAGDEARELGLSPPHGNSNGGGDTVTDTNGDEFEVSVFAGATGGAGVGRGSNIEGGTVVGTTGAPGGQVRYAREPKAWENT